MTVDELRAALEQIEEAALLTRNIPAMESRIDDLITKAHRVLWEASNRVRNMIEAEEQA